MAERDYKVVYRSRPTDNDVRDGRNRMVTALDPYQYPEDRMELKRNVAEAKIRAHAGRRDNDLDAYELHPDDSVSQREFPTSANMSRTAGSTITERDAVEVKATTGANGLTTKTTYAVKRDGTGGDAYITSATRSITNGPTAPPLQSSKTTTSVLRDRDFDRRDVTPPALSRYPTAPTREYAPVEYDVEPLSRQNGGYVIETRRGNNVDIYVAGKDPDRGNYRDDRYVEVVNDDYRGRRTPTSTPREGKKYQKEYRHERVSRSPNDPRSSTRTVEIVNDGGPYASGAIIVDEPRGGYSVEHPKTPSRSARIEEDDWKVIDSNPSSSSQLSAFRDPFHDNAPIDKRGRTRGRSFATQNSEDEYVFVSPVQKTKTVALSGMNGNRTEKTSATLRSAMIREDTYTPEERMYRRRSRSAHFRDADIPRHMVGEMKHERPGEEAAICGKYLKHYDDYDDRAPRGYYDAEYDRKTVVRERSRDRDTRSAAPTSRYAPQDYAVPSSEVSRYPPQRSYSASRRDRDEDAHRHRHRRHHGRRYDDYDDDDDETYYSRRI